MEEFFLKLGFMTQRNHAELIKELRELKISVDNLTAEIKTFADCLTFVLHFAKFQADRTKTKFGKYPFVSGEFKPVERQKTQVVSTKADATKQEWDIKVFITFYKFSVTELLRLTAANQMMNLIGK